MVKATQSQLKWQGEQQQNRQEAGWGPGCPVWLQICLFRTRTYNSESLGFFAHTLAFPAPASTEASLSYASHDSELQSLPQLSRARTVWYPPLGEVANPLLLKVLCFWWEKPLGLPILPLPLYLPTPLWLPALLEVHHTWGVLRQEATWGGKKPLSNVTGKELKYPSLTKPQMIPECSQQTSLLVQVKVTYILIYTTERFHTHKY